MNGSGSEVHGCPEVDDLSKVLGLDILYELFPIGLKGVASVMGKVVKFVLIISDVTIIGLREEHELGNRPISKGQIVRLREQVSNGLFWGLATSEVVKLLESATPAMFDERRLGIFRGMLNGPEQVQLIDHVDKIVLVIFDVVVDPLSATVQGFLW
jgi:hypothetical protein